MGFGYRVDAGKTEEAWSAICAKQNGSSNTYEVDGVVYFYEVDRKDQPDGGLRGAVWQIMPDGLARSKGRFSIAGDGSVVRWPVGMKRLVAEVSAN